MKEFDKLSTPFSEDILKKASEIANNYHIIIEENECLGFVGHAGKFPTVFGDGKTREECEKNVREATIIAVAYMLENGREEFIPEIDK